ncbi:abortive phage infection protein [Psychrobacillus psychrodurans]|uniref:abortive phage infection protein n=1 Tax=Psychrobacillus psychrodurans TaxID=126157 RepID=UPI001F4E6EEF|nr:abortive phage infection protein [Psychrobacillus psychrodurans]MCK1996355.1 abortive phage infection protein [Psychrobacillus psychrodurans]
MQESYEEKLNMLQNGDIQNIVVEKNEFIAFREVLVHREDFKHFSGNAEQGGRVVYTYLNNPRS